MHVYAFAFTHQFWIILALRSKVPKKTHVTSSWTCCLALSWFSCLIRKAKSWTGCPLLISTDGSNRSCTQMKGVLYSGLIVVFGYVWMIYDNEFCGIFIWHFNWLSLQRLKPGYNATLMMMAHLWTVLDPHCPGVPKTQMHCWKVTWIKRSTQCQQQRSHKERCRLAWIWDTL